MKSPPGKNLISIYISSCSPFPVEIKLRMDIWKKMIPDYSFRRWRMEDALSLNCKFVNEALQCRKWAFAADVVRLYALYMEGGVYMDCDVFYAEVAESFGFEYINKKQELNNGIIIYDSKFLTKTKRDQCKDSFGVHRISHSWITFSEYPLAKRIEKRLKHFFKVCKYSLFRR